MPLLTSPVFKAHCAQLFGTHFLTIFRLCLTEFIHNQGYLPYSKITSQILTLLQVPQAESITPMTRFPINICKYFCTSVTK